MNSPQRRGGGGEKKKKVVERRGEGKEAIGKGRTAFKRVSPVSDIELSARLI